jgi:hypothetical protein
MRELKEAAGLPSLRSVVATASSARVLDLHALAAENLDDPDYAERPMFIHPVLNRSIIVKHNVSETDRLTSGRLEATKVIFPFDQLDLRLGGQLLFVEERDFIGLFNRHLDYTDRSLDRDLRVLRILDKLPTLDPFLVRESLKLQQIEVGRCYYRFSESDKAEMLDFVGGEIGALIQQCFGEMRGNDKRMQRLAQLFLADQESPELEPLRATFRMEASEFSEALFSWKAFLYYRWRSQALSPMLKSTLSSISAIRAGRFERDELSFVIRAKRLLEKTITNSWREVSRRLRLYDGAFSALTGRENPGGFRAFLMNGSGMFIELGERIGRLEQIVSFWAYRFGDERVTGISSDEAIEAMRDLLQTLSLSLEGRTRAVSREAAPYRLRYRSSTW